jgi:hypothetical protein
MGAAYTDEIEQIRRSVTPGQDDRVAGTGKAS